MLFKVRLTTKRNRTTVIVHVPHLRREIAAEKTFGVGDTADELLCSGANRLSHTALLFYARLLLLRAKRHTDV